MRLLSWELNFITQLTFDYLFPCVNTRKKIVYAHNASFRTKREEINVFTYMDLQRRQTMKILVHSHLQIKNTNVLKTTLDYVRK